MVADRKRFPGQNGFKKFGLRSSVKVRSPGFFQSNRSHFFGDMRGRQSTPGFFEKLVFWNPGGRVATRRVGRKMLASH